MGIAQTVGAIDLPKIGFSIKAVEYAINRNVAAPEITAAVQRRELQADIVLKLRINTFELYPMGYRSVTAICSS
jgi:hypothetical protein